MEANLVLQQLRIDVKHRSQTLSQTTSMDQPSPIPSDNTSSVPVSTILPQLQFILQQNTMQRDQIATVMKYMSQVEAPPAYYSSSLASKPTSHDGAENYMIVYDITDMDSFDHVKNWLTEIERYTSDNVNKILVGNKCDLAEKRAVEQQMAKAFANDVGIPFLETSAKDATNVEQAFLTMAREIKKRVGGQTTSNNSQIGTVEMKGKPLQQKSNCCS